jgi:Predicted Rossmann fold nucleotide-binding protein
MGACARGVLQEGGRPLGIAPRFFDEPGVLLKDGCNFLFTSTMAERKSRMEEEADAFIAMPGGIGTFEEFFEVLTLKQLAQHQKPLALLNTLGYFDNLDRLLRVTAEKGFMSAEVLGLYALCTSPEEAMDHVTQPVSGDFFRRSLSDYNT